MTGDDVKPKSNPSRRLRWLIFDALLIVVAVIAYRACVEQQRRANLLAELQAEEKLRLPLEKMVTMKFGKEVPLRTWLAEFTRQTGMVVAVGPESNGTDASDAARFVVPSFQNEIPIWLDLPPMSAEELLETVAELYEVRWMVRADGVAVLNCNQDEMPRTIRVYPLPAALGSDAEDKLRDLLTTYVEPGNWEEFGAGATVEMSPGVFTVLQTEHAHRGIERFLSALAAAQARGQSLPAIGLAHDDPAWQPLWLAGDQQRLLAWQRALDRPITLQAVDLPWLDFVAQLSEQAQFPIVLHPRDFRWTHIFSTPVTCRLHKVPLWQVLEQVFGEDPNGESMFGFVPAAGGRMLEIAAFDRLTGISGQTPLAYSVGDLIRAGHEADRDALQEVIENSIHPGYWNHSGDPASLAWADSGRLLLISERLAFHQQFRELLSALRQVRGGQRRSVVCLPAVAVHVQSAEVIAKLDTQLSFQYRGVTRQRALEDVFVRGDITVPALEGGLLHAQGPLWCYLPARPLRENLELLLDACDYDLQYLDNITLRTSPPEVYRDDAELLACQVFDLRPGLATQGTALEVGGLIRDVVEPDHWQEVGGPGSLTPFRQLLIARAHPRILRRVSQLLDDLQDLVTPGRPRQWHGRVLKGEALNQPLDLRSPTDPQVVRARAIASRNEVLNAKLRQRVSVSIRKRILGDALLDLAREYDLPLVTHALPAPFDPFAAKGTDRLAPANSFVSFQPKADELISFEAEDTPLGEIIQQLIGDPAQLTWQVQDGYLTIAPSSSETPPVATLLLYSVDDLLVPRGPLLPKQLWRTLESQLADADGDGNPKTTKTYLDFHFGNLFLLNTDAEQPSRQLLEQALRKLRSGELPPQPPMKGDSDFSIPQYPRFPPGFTIPVVGRRPGTKLK